MLNAQEQALIKLYKAMSSAAIARRLANPDLTALARGVAENELHRRSVGARQTEQNLPLAPSQGSSAAGVAVALVILAALLTAGVAFLLHSSWAPLFLLIAVCVLARVLGKLMPLLGKILGVLLVAAAGAMVVYGFMAKVSTEERMLIFVFGAMAVFVLLMMAYNLINGAGDKKSWGAFAADLDAKQQQSKDSLR